MLLPLVVLGDSSVLKILRHLGLVIIGKNSFFVEGKHLRNLELTIHHSASEHFLDHLLLRGCSVSSSDEVAIVDSCLRLAFFELRASLALSLMNIGSALLGDKVAVFEQKAVEEGPSSITSFV